EPPATPMTPARDGPGSSCEQCVAGLLAREVRLALLDIGAQAFLGVVALEQLLLQFALDGERGFERHLDPALHRALDASHRLGGTVRRAESLRVLLDLIQE